MLTLTEKESNSYVDFLPCRVILTRTFYLPARWNIYHSNPGHGIAYQRFFYTKKWKVIFPFVIHLLVLPDRSNRYVGGTRGVTMTTAGWSGFFREGSPEAEKG